MGAAVVADAQVLCRTLWPESGTGTCLLVLCTRGVTESFLLPLWRPQGQGDVDLGVKTPSLLPFEEDAQDCRAALSSWEPDAFLSGLECGQLAGTRAACLLVVFQACTRSVSVLIFHL